MLEHGSKNQYTILEIQNVLHCLSSNFEGKKLASLSITFFFCVCVCLAAPVFTTQFCALFLCHSKKQFQEGSKHKATLHLLRRTVLLTSIFFLFVTQLAVFTFMFFFFFFSSCGAGLLQRAVEVCKLYTIKIENPLNKLSSEGQAAGRVLLVYVPDKPSHEPKLSS